MLTVSVMTPWYGHLPPLCVHLESLLCGQPDEKPAIARPPNSLCEMRTPVSRMYTTPPAPLALPYVYVPSRAAWQPGDGWQLSIRSRFHGAADCELVARTPQSASTSSTSSRPKSRSRVWLCR